MGKNRPKIHTILYAWVRNYIRNRFSHQDHEVGTISALSFTLIPKLFDNLVISNKTMKYKNLSE